VHDFSRYLGNLGILPENVYSLIKEGAPKVLENGRLPAKWMTNAWLSVGKLLRTGAGLG
jgi:hypothetical protein